MSTGHSRDDAGLQAQLRAAHEAGHAVVARAAGFEVLSCTAVPTRDYQGHTELAPITDERFFCSGDRWAWVICTMAGWASWMATAIELLGVRPSFEATLLVAQRSGDCDVPLVRRFLAEHLDVPPRAIELEVRRAFDVAASLVALLQREMDAVAGVLRERHRIDGSRIDAVLGGVDGWPARRAEAMRLIRIAYDDESE